MFEYLSVEQVLELHEDALAQWGGRPGVRDMGGVESAVAQPRQSVFGEDAYPTLEEKAVALGYSILRAQHFVDANKRTGHNAMVNFLGLNGYEIDADDDEQEHIVLLIAGGNMSREDFVAWVRAKIRPLSPDCP